MKDNFLLKKEHQEIFTALTNEEAGELIKGIFNYVCTGDSGLKGVLNAVFVPIKKVIDDNEEKYKKICERNKQNGVNGGRPRNNEKTQENPMGYVGKENEDKETQNNPTGNFGENTHISYITNQESYNHNSNLEKIGCGEEKPLKADDSSLLLETTKKVVAHLNEKTGSNFRYSSKATQTKVNARLNEKYTLDDFITVIDKKVKEWTGTEFEKYLCPETLFGTKFEKYLNQKETKAKPQTKSDKQMEILKGVYDETIKIS